MGAPYSACARLGDGFRGLRRRKGTLVPTTATATQTRGLTRGDRALAASRGSDDRGRTPKLVGQ